MNYIRITKENIDREHICCAMSGKQSIAKKEWLRQRFEEGLVFYRSEERGKCFIEYIPAENAWVPIMADGWLYINCLWVSGSMKGHGYSNDLLEECIRDARAQGKNGLCILCAEGRKREFLADPKFLAHREFRVADISDCGIDLRYLPLVPNAEPPRFRECAKHPAIAEAGFVLYYTDQCPYTYYCSKGAGGGKRTRYPVQGHPHHGQRIRAERSRAGHDLCAVPGRQVFDAEHSVRQKISGTGWDPGLSHRTSESRRFMCGYAELIPAPGDPPRSFSSSPPSAARRRGRCTRHRR